MPLQIPNAVKWQWYNDKTWANFDTKIMDNMEMEYTKNKTKKIKVDKERFVDVDFKSEAEIKKNFNGMDKENGLIGIQRRYDDEMKRRAVRRVVPDIFSSETFAILLPKKEKEPLKEAIELYQGLVCEKITKKVTFVVSESSDLEDYESELETAKEHGIDVVSVDFILDSIKDSKLVSPSKYKLKLKKRKKEDQEEGPPKKVKKDESPEKKSSSSNEAMKEKTEWMGVCSYKLEKKHFPVKMTVEKVTTKPDGRVKVGGLIEWPTLNGATTKFKGTIDGKVFTFKEYEAVKGKDEVEIPTSYTGKFTDKETIDGRVNIADLEGEEVSFNLKLTKSVQKEDTFPMLKEKKEFKGECYQTFPFTFVITSRKDDKVTGTVKWPTLNTKTKFKGRIEDDNLIFDELDIEEGDGVEVPVSYNGKLNSKEKKVEGKFGPNLTKNQITGTFKIFLDSQ